MSDPMDELMKEAARRITETIPGVTASVERVRDCEHGKLARSCDICELTVELAALRAERDALEDAKEAYREKFAFAKHELAAALARGDALAARVEGARALLDDQCPNCHYAAQSAVAAANDGLAPMPAFQPYCDYHEGVDAALRALSPESDQGAEDA